MSSSRRCGRKLSVRCCACSRSVTKAGSEVSTRTGAACVKGVGGWDRNLWSQTYWEYVDKSRSKRRPGFYDMKSGRDGVRIEGA